MEPLRKIAEGREAEVFAWQDGTVLRLLRDPTADAQTTWEVAALEAARASGCPVPAVHGVVQVAGRPGVVLERVEGRDYLTLLERQPWRLIEAARVLGEVHAQLHGVRAPEGLRPLRATLRDRIERSALVPAALKPRLLERLDALPDGDAVCHGDYHPANLIVAGGRPVVIDWTNVTRGDPHADVARTVLLIRLGEPPPGSGLLVRLFASVGRRVLLAGYLRAYRRHRSLDMAAVERWLVPVAAARLTEGIESERRALLRLLK